MIVKTIIENVELDNLGRRFRGILTGNPGVMGTPEIPV